MLLFIHREPEYSRGMKTFTPLGNSLVSLLIVVALIGVFAYGIVSYTGSGGTSSVDSGMAALEKAEQLQDFVTNIRTEQQEALSGEVLDLSGQGLTSVPSSVFSRTDIVDLNLSNNALTGALPGEIRHLKNLRRLNVSNNRMTGIPAEVGQLAQLEELNYAGNSITGIPHEVGQLKNLKIFNLAGSTPSQYDVDIISEQLPGLNWIYE